MSYQVLARKWRPRSFDELVGQEHVARTLRNSIQANRLAHAYIFAGLRERLLIGRPTLIDHILASSALAATWRGTTILNGATSISGSGFRLEALPGSPSTYRTYALAFGAVLLGTLWVWLIGGRSALAIFTTVVGCAMGYLMATRKLSA